MKKIKLKQFDLYYMKVNAIYIMYDQIIKNSYDKVTKNVKKIVGNTNQNNRVLSGRAESKKSIQPNESGKELGKELGRS